MTQAPGARAPRGNRQHGAQARRAIAAAAGVTLVAGLASLAPGAAEARSDKAPTVTSVQAYAGAVKVTSSKHHKLMVSTSASKGNGSAPTLSVSVALPNGRESHTWQFQLPKKGLSINSKGSGHVKASAKKTGHFAVVSLKLSGHGRVHKSKCQGQAISGSRKATISGTFVFDTKSKWGKVGSTKRKFHFSAKSQVYWNYANSATCSSPPPACSANTSWSLSKSSTKTYLSLYGGKTGKHAYVYGSRGVMLAKPKGAYRSDYLTMAKPKAPKLTVKSDDTATLKVFAGKGSATLSGTTPAPPTTQPCGKGAKSEAFQSWYGVTVKQNKPPAKLPAQIEGAISLPKSAIASFSRVRVTG